MKCWRPIPGSRHIRARILLFSRQQNPVTGSQREATMIRIVMVCTGLLLLLAVPSVADTAFIGCSLDNSAHAFDTGTGA